MSRLLGQDLTGREALVNENMVRDHLKEMMEGGAAHIGFDKAVDGFPVDRAGQTLKGLEHTMWMLVEHLRLVNRDLIDWVTSEDYTSKPYPKGYWPAEPGPADADEWKKSIEAVRRDMELMRSWISDEEHDITAPLERNAAHSAMREILLAVAHNGYHVGQMVDLRALLGVPVRDW